MSEAAWSLEQVTLTGRDRPRLDDVSLEIPDGVTAVMGSSGAGKSSLLGLLTDFEKPDAGSVRFLVSESTSRLPLFWSPQDHGLWPHLSVREHLEYVRPSTPQIDRPVETWLELFGMESLRNSLPGSLSQGERSRLGVLRALASEAAVLVLDEPLVHVDPLLAHQCWQVVDEHFQRHCSAAVFSTHDPDTVLKFAQNVACLQQGKVGFFGSVDALRFEPPTRELAWLLGPCNWFSRAAAKERCPDGALTGFEEVVAGNRSGIDQHERPAVCVRPAQLQLEPEKDSHFVVESIVRAATVIEVRLHDRRSDSRCDVFVAQLSSDVGLGEAVRVIVHPPR